jgi:putative ABC transport system permease protein
VKAIDKKLVRDLGRMKGQLVTIALVVAVGIACFVALKGNFDSLQYARATYYERSRFGDVFAHLERAPEALIADLEAIDGVARVESRVVLTEATSNADRTLGEARLRGGDAR